MKQCDNCGNQDVSDSFHRNYSDNAGVLHGCQDCCTNRELPVRPSDVGAVPASQRHNGWKITE